jgi:hypothetical protein
MARRYRGGAGASVPEEAWAPAAGYIADEEAEMPRVTEDAFAEGSEIVRVYLAASRSEGESVERALDAIGVDYLAEPEQYAARWALGSRVRTGVGFWVTEEALDAAAGALERAGLRSGLVER